MKESHPSESYPLNARARPPRPSGPDVLLFLSTLCTNYAIRNLGMHLTFAFFVRVGSCSVPFDLTRPQFPWRWPMRERRRNIELRNGGYGFRKMGGQVSPLRGAIKCCALSIQFVVIVFRSVGGREESTPLSGASAQLTLRRSRREDLRYFSLSLSTSPHFFCLERVRALPRAFFMRSRWTLDFSWRSWRKAPTWPV